MDDEKLDIYLNQCRSDFIKRESELNDQMETLFKKQLTIKEITEQVIKQYSDSKLIETHFNDKSDFFFGYDELLISANLNETNNLCFEIKRRTRPLYDFDEEQLSLRLEFDFEIDREQYWKEFGEYIESDEQEEIIKGLKTLSVYNLTKDLIPTSYKVSTRYDA